MKIYDIAIASDHTGYLLKSKIIQYLNNCALLVKDYGINNNEVVDYPDYAYKVVDGIVEENIKNGILICGTGIGMSIAANRRSDIRAALCLNPYMAEMARSHNDANILVLPSKLISDDQPFEIIDKFLNTSFEGGRHSVRLSKLI